MLPEVAHFDSQQLLITFVIGIRRGLHPSQRSEAYQHIQPLSVRV